jgi:hypothetical protein
VNATRISVLVLVLILTLVLVWLLCFLSDSVGLVLPRLAVLVPISLVGLALAVAIGAWLTYRTVWVKKELLEPRPALFRLALAKAASLAAAIIVGAYLAIALYGLPYLYVPGIAQRFWVALATAGAALALGISGYCLELACRVPPADDSSQKTQALRGID